MDNVIRFPVVARPIPVPVPTLPTFLHAWKDFIAVVEVDNEALPIRGRAADEGPQFEFDGHYVLSADVEDWDLAVLWLSPCLMQIASAVLAESLDAKDGIGRFNSSRWDAFRREVVQIMRMDWKEVLEGARREGVDFMADHVAANLLIESKLADRLRTA